MYFQTVLVERDFKFYIRFKAPLYIPIIFNSVCYQEVGKGKGLGKGGAKSHHKALRDNTQGSAKPDKHRLVCCGGVNEGDQCSGTTWWPQGPPLECHPSPTQNTPRGRRSQLWISSFPSRGSCALASFTLYLGSSIDLVLVRTKTYLIGEF